jgi:ankyrin repeat protein
MHLGACRTLAPFVDERRIAVRNLIGDTPLHVAAQNGHCENIRVLLELVESLEEMLNLDGYSVLHATASSASPHPKVTALLVYHIKRSSNRKLVNALCTRFQNSALHLAARNANTTAEFVACFEDLDPTLPRQHHAAEREDNSEIIITVLRI